MKDILAKGIKKIIRLFIEIKIMSYVTLKTPKNSKLNIANFDILDKSSY